MLAEGVVGTLVKAVGSIGQNTYDESGGCRIAQAHAPYEDAVRRLNVYTASTAAAGVAPGTSIGTTAAYALQNPKGSAMRLNLMAAFMGYLSGTLSAGMVVLVGHLSQSGAAVTGTAITPVCCSVGNNKTGVGLAYTTATVVTGGSLLYPVWNLDAELASSVVGSRLCMVELGGITSIEPGAAVSLQGIAAAGTSPLVVFGMIWEEVPM